MFQEKQVNLAHCTCKGVSLKRVSILHLVKASDREDKKTKKP